MFDPSKLKQGDKFHCIKYDGTVVEHTFIAYVDDSSPCSMVVFKDEHNILDRCSEYTAREKFRYIPRVVTRWVIVSDKYDDWTRPTNRHFDSRDDATMYRDHNHPDDFVAKLEIYKDE